MSDTVRRGVCRIVSAGDASGVTIPPSDGGDLVIACDAGYRSLESQGIVPDVFVGDGDSLGYIPEASDVVALKCEKDDTDTEAAIKYATDLGYRRIELYGALGGERPSHSVANLGCLLLIKERGAEGVLIDRRCRARVAVPEDGRREIDSGSRYFSLFPLDGDSCVTVECAKYEARRATLRFSSTLGVSNEPRRGCALTVHSGAVLIIEDN